MKLNQAGIDLIKAFEGCKLTVYKDAVGLPTVGYGHMDKTLLVGSRIDQAEADSLLATDLAKVALRVYQLVKTTTLTDNQLSALVCLAFNIGTGNLASSTLLKRVLMGDFVGAADQFLVWNKAGGQVLDGLTRRRKAERTLFLA